MKTYRLFAQLILILIAIFSGLATATGLGGASPAVPICFVAALGFSALLVPEDL